MTDQPLASDVAPEIMQRLQASVPAAFAVLAGMQLDVFTHLADGPHSAAYLAKAMGVAPDRLSRLLYALVVAELLEHQAEGFANTPEAAAFLVKGLPGYLGGSHELMSQLWHADLRTADSIRTGRPAALHDFTAASDAEMAAMLRGMHPNAVAAGHDFLRRFDFSACRSLVDVGGGSGGLVATLCQAHPALRGMLYDLPRTIALAAPILRDTPGGDRVRAEPGDILRTSPPELHDAVTMRALVQVLGPEDAAQAIRHAAAALRPGGTIYIAGGGILDDNRLGPRNAVFLNVTFMNIYAGGTSYTYAQHAEWLAAARCEDARRIILPNGASIIYATKRA